MSSDACQRVHLLTLSREKGVGTTSDSGNSTQYDSNKTEVLRLLLVLLSRQIYVPSAALFTNPSLYALYMVQKTSRRDVLTILCSLLNTAMNSTAGSQITIGSMAGKLPYNHLVFKGEDPRTGLVATCLQVLLALLDFQSGSARDKVDKTDAQVTAPTIRTNAFRYFVMKLVSFASSLPSSISDNEVSEGPRTLTSFSMASQLLWDKK